MTNTQFLDLIKKLALQYDSLGPSFPEGLCFYEFVCNVLDFPPEDLQNTHKEVYDRFRDVSKVVGISPEEINEQQEKQEKRRRLYEQFKQDFKLMLQEHQK
jgi:hypothetical protein